MTLSEKLQAIDESPAPEPPTSGNIYPVPCIHGDGKALCPNCQTEYDVDPSAYDEFGEHPQGIANWKAMQEEIATDAVQHTPTRDDSIPF